MAKIPTYDNFQAQEQVQPNVQVQAPQGPTPGAIAAQQQDAMGKGMLGLGNQVAIIAAKEQAEQDKFRLEEASQKADRAAQEILKDFQKLKGSDALAGDEENNGPDYLRNKQLKAQLDEIGKSLGTESQRRAFALKAGDLQNRFNGAITDHMSRENTVYQLSVVKGGIALGKQVVSDAGTDQTAIQAGIDKIRSSIAMNPLKMSPEELKAEELKELSQAHTLAIKSLMTARDSAGAKAYFEKNKKEFVGDQKATMEEYIAKVGDAQIGVEAGSSVFNKAMDGKPLTAEVTYKAMDAELLAKFKDNPDQLRAARAELDRQVGIWNKQQSESEASSINSVYELKNKNTNMATIMASDAWNGLSEKNKSLFKKQWSEEADTSLSRSIHRMQLLETQRTIESAPTMLQFHANPEALTRMTEAQITQLAPSIGMKNAGDLLTMRSKFMSSQAALSQGKIDNDTFESIAAAAGIDPKPKSSDKVASAKVWNLRQAVEMEIGAKQQSVKGELPADQKKQIMNEVISREVKKGGWFGSTVPAATLNPEDLSKSSVVVDGTSVKMSSVPTDELIKTKQMLKRLGLPSDDVSAVREWHITKNQKTQ